MSTHTRPVLERIREEVAGRKYGATIVPWLNLGIGMGFSTEGPYFGCLACRYGYWVPGHSRKANLEALQDVLAHILTCPRQPQDGPIIEQALGDSGVTGAVITSKGSYALVTGAPSDDECRELHDRLVSEDE